MSPLQKLKMALLTELLGLRELNQLNPGEHEMIWLLEHDSDVIEARNYLNSMGD